MRYLDKHGKLRPLEDIIREAFTSSLDVTQINADLDRIAAEQVECAEYIRDCQEDR